MKGPNYHQKLKFLIIFPLVASMAFMGISSISNASITTDQTETTVVAANIYLKLQLNGLDIEGDSTVHSLERENTIVIYSFRLDVEVPRDISSGRTTGRRLYSPIIVTKRIDKSSPLLMQGLATNQVADGEFRFYRPSTGGAGSEEHYYTVKFERGFISAIRVFTIANEGGVYHMEEVSFAFQIITWIYEIGGIEYQDSWSGDRA